MFINKKKYLLNIQGKRGLSLSKTVSFDRLNQLCRAFLRRYKKKMVWLLVITAVLLTFSLVAASGELLPRSVVSGGGGMVSEGGLALSRAIGQPVVGAVENGLALCSGFLCGSGAPVGGGDFYVYLPLVIR